MRKCPYCDFNSYALSGELPEAAYVAALRRDLREQGGMAEVAGRALTTVFMGGGTRKPVLAAGYRAGVG